MKISMLADHREVIPTLAGWFYQEWSHLVPDLTVKDIEKRIDERTNTDKIPLALVAFENNDLIGTVCLKTHDMESHPELTPWLAGLYVALPWRRKGIGAALVSAIEKKALEFGVETLYLHTPKSESFYAKLGWQVLERTEYHHCPVTIMKKNII